MIIMYSIILTIHIAGAILFFCASLITFFSYLKPYRSETYRKLSFGISALLLGEFASGSSLAIIAYKPINYLHFCGSIALYAIIAFATFYVLRQKRREADRQTSFPSFAHTFSLAGIVSLVRAHLIHSIPRDLMVQYDHEQK